MAPGAAQKGDFQPGHGNRNGAHTTQKGDFQPTQQGIHGQMSAQKGDFQNSLPSAVTRKGDFQEQSGAIVAQKGDFQGTAQGASLNDNVITIIYNDSFEDGYDSDNDAAACAPQEDHYSSGEAAKVGRQLALYLEKTPENTGGFVNKCKQYSRTVIRASMIDMLVHAAFPQVDLADERGRPRNQASWFHNACKKYGMPGTRIPAFVEVWLKTDLSWEEIEGHLGEAALRYKNSMIAGSRTADLVRQWLRGEIDQMVLDEALQSRVLSQENQLQRAPKPLTSASSATNGLPLVAVQAVPHVEKTWMDEDEAEILAEEILRDAGPFGVSKAVAKQEHGVSVVMLTWRGTTFSMKMPQQWRKHLEQVRPHFERMQRKGESNGNGKTH